MGLGAALIGSSAIGAGASLFGAKKGADAAKQAAKEQAGFANQNFDAQQGFLDELRAAAGEASGKTDELLAQGRTDIGTAYNNVLNIIKNIPSVSDLYGEGQQLSQKDYDYRLGIKRQQLDFILGEPQATSGLREAQSFSSDLANLEEGATSGKFNKIIKSSLLGLKADTVGEPTGTFSNTSAKNLFNFSQQGLSNYLAINDFFAKNGNVDPISPLQTAFQLFGTKEDIAKLGIQNEQWQGSELVGLDKTGIGAAQQGFQNAASIASFGSGITSQYYNQLGQLSGTSALADAQFANSIGPAIGQLTQGISSAYGLGLQQTALNNQQQQNQYLLAGLNAKSLGNFAPSNRYSFDPNISSYPIPIASPAGFNNPASAGSSGENLSSFSTGGRLESSLFPSGTQTPEGRQATQWRYTHPEMFTNGLGEVADQMIPYGLGLIFQ